MAVNCVFINSLKKINKKVSSKELTVLPRAEAKGS